MGCSASRSADFIAQHQNPNSIAGSSHWNSLLQSPYNSFSDPNSTPASRTRSLPTPLVHHPPVRKGDSNHFVALTSTTYGSLLLLSPSKPTPDFETQGDEMAEVEEFGGSEKSLPPEFVVNTWELMEGLDENESAFQIVDPHNGNAKSEIHVSEMAKSHDFVENLVSKPLWEHLSEESLLARMDENVVSSYRKALMGKQVGYGKLMEVPKHQKYEDLLRSPNAVKSNSSDESCCLLGAEDRIVLYYTTLRGIRKTYEDCCAVRVILRGFRVFVDERDISMDRSYRAELQQVLQLKSVSLPQVFIRGKHIGGAEDIKQLNEAGDLAKLLEGFPLTDIGFVCEVCGDARFVPCPNCNGSRKVYEQEDRSLRRCADCNENGLVRCSCCCPL